MHSPEILLIWRKTHFHVCSTWRKTKVSGWSKKDSRRTWTCNLATAAASICLFEEGLEVTVFPVCYQSIVAKNMALFSSCLLKRHSVGGCPIFYLVNNSWFTLTQFNNTISSSRHLHSVNTEIHARTSCINSETKTYLCNCICFITILSNTLCKCKKEAFFLQLPWLRK